MKINITILFVLVSIKCFLHYFGLPDTSIRRGGLNPIRHIRHSGRMTFWTLASAPWDLYHLHEMVAYIGLHDNERGKLCLNEPNAISTYHPSAQLVYLWYTKAQRPGQGVQPDPMYSIAFKQDINKIPSSTRMFSGLNFPVALFLRLSKLTA